MWIFNLLNILKEKVGIKQNTEIISENIDNAHTYVDASSISPDERSFYQEKEYYTYYSYPGTPSQIKVISFDERKKTCIPSQRGLYVAEILLLSYCQKGDYPKPGYGYPGLWWFEYGIRDVGHALESLAQRGFIQFAPLNRSVRALTIPELKKLLKAVNAPVSGKKDDLIARTAQYVSDDILVSAGIKQKYELTGLGEKELADNAYVPYMHKTNDKTIDLSPTEPGFNVWRINKELGLGDKSDWKKLVDAIKDDMDQKTAERNQLFMEDLKELDPDGYRTLKAQDEQLNSIKKAEENYKKDKDLDALINFWENLWQSGGPNFAGSHWLFRLPDLYIRVKRYDDALTLCKKIQAHKDSYYYEKANTYMQKITKLKEKLQ